VFLQLAPLPEQVLKVISPGTPDFYAETRAAIGPAPDAAHSTIRFNNTVSLNPYATRTELFKLLAYTGVFFLVLGNITTRGQERRFLAAVIIIGFVLSVFALVQHFTWNGKIYWLRDVPRGAGPFASFINKNNFAGYINLIIPVTLGMVMARRDKSKKVLFGFMAVVMATALFLSLSRGGVFAFGGGMLFMGVFLLSTRYGGGYRKTVLLLAAFLLPLLLYLVYMGIDPVMDRLATLTERETYIKEGRWAVWAATAGIFKDYPVFGTGLDTFGSVFPAYQPPEASGLLWLDAHNDYLQLLAETGIVGTAIALGFFVLLFKRAFCALNSREHGPRSYLLAALLASVVAFLLSVVLTFNTRIPANALMFAVILAMVVKLSGAGKRDFHAAR
jgi:O-antigen ligase